MSEKITERVKKEKIVLSKAGRRKKIKNSFIAYAMLLPAFVFLFMFTLYPIGSSIYSSLFKDNLSVIAPQFVGLKNYTGLAKDAVFVQSFKNNLLIAALTVPVSIILSVAMALFTDKIRIGKSFARTAFFYPTILPMVAVANIWLFTKIGVILPFFASAMGILMMRQTVKTIPYELEEAANIDGCGMLRILTTIYVPLLKPVYIAFGLVSASYQWNNFLWPLVMINSEKNRPLTLGLAIFAMAAETGANRSATCAATLVVVLPLLVIFIIFQKQFMQSFATSGIK